jgi:hypothetical protein
MDNDTGVVTVGAGMPINVLNQKLQNAGGRAIPHGIAPGIGIGGHAGIVSPILLLKVVRSVAE